MELQKRAWVKPCKAPLRVETSTRPRSSHDTPNARLGTHSTFTIVRGTQALTVVFDEAVETAPSVAILTSRFDNWEISPEIPDNSMGYDVPFRVYFSVLRASPVTSSKAASNMTPSASQFGMVPYHIHLSLTGQP